MIKKAISGKLFLKIYTFGYESCGESSLFVIRDNNDVLYSGLIDVFSKNLKNIVETLEAENISFLDYFCITHPDLDHCCGFNDILCFINNKTIICYPFRMIDDQYQKFYSDEVKENVRYLKKVIINEKHKIKPVSGIKEIVSSISYVDFLSNIYDFSIYTISPCDQIVEIDKMKIDDEIKKKICKNDLSVTTYLNLGDLQLLFCSDITNNSINFIFENESKIIDNIKNYSINYLKIPHHSSSGSSDLIDCLNDNRLENSVSTVYRSSNLPSIDVLKGYRLLSDNLLLTGKVLSSEKKNNYGIVKITYCLTDSNYCISFDGDGGYY